MPPWLEPVLALLAWLIGLARRPHTPEPEEAYAAKAKEAEALAKPDADWADVVDRL